MGRPKLWDTAISVKFTREMLDAVAAVLSDGEDRAAFTRAAIEREVARRKRSR